MTEDDYWVHLEYRVSRELMVIENNAFRALWCDGFIPESYVLDTRDPHIAGHVWICTGRQQDRWEFWLDIRDLVGAKEDVPWAKLLPNDEMTGWLIVDVNGRKIHINPFHEVAA